MGKCLWLAVALALLSPAVSGAQPRRDADRRRGAERAERIARVIADCERRTDEFLRAVERARQRDRRENRASVRDDDLTRAASRMERALNRIRDSWNRDRDFNRTRGHVGTATSAGQDVNRILRRHRLSSYVEREWAAIRNELNNLADVFDERPIRW
jgi:hypothetical protein